jgi:hypothetical protein
LKTLLGLRARKTPAHEITPKVQKAADMLAIRHLLNVTHVSYRAVSYSVLPLAEQLCAMPAALPL